ncbi:preprotein translocase subunit SecE [Alicyclobacillus fastidiosus]|uniref:Protein translocase subunit SecE n=1 Tax=Alicyclobacillus fastidiosus TaxID=392011 RepID=A0ABV5AIX7_9BACL|nr:preprotein translocase subunit SecE [Alicyclobacillus fastidiosus]WEH09979.1 preprotein translocase subunit SecE [Alicyclobacillus fastidiosus]
MAKANESLVEAKARKRSGFFAFFAESWRELRRVRWPKRREIVLYTAASLVLCVILGLLIWGFDIGVSRLLTFIGVV